LLWISLVVLWLFVLVPMLINKRDTVRRTSDIALATRVINSDARSRLIRRGGPSTGHRHDPDWQCDDELDETYSDRQDDVEEYDDAVRAARGTRTYTSSVMVVTSVTEEALTEPVYIDVDVVDENSGALPVGNGVQESLFDSNAQSQVDTDVHAIVGYESAAEAESFSEPSVGEPGPAVDPEPVAEPVAETDVPDGTGDEYEYIDDTSGLEAEDSPATAPRRGNRQRRLESTTAADVSARKYRFRKRVLLAMSTIMVATAMVSFTISPAFWWACGTSAVITLLYLGYLRRQTRIEEQVRRRRQKRMAGLRPEYERDAEWSAPGRRVPESGRAADVDDYGSRYQRAGAVVLDIDDEDPVFEHLDEVAYSRRYDLPRAAGQ
jgi:hypothetical protein